MSDPFVFITAHAISSGEAEELMRLTEEYAQFIETNEPGARAFTASVNEDVSELSLIHTFADASAADTHVQLAGPYIGKGVSHAKTVRVEVFGRPGPVLTRALEANAAAGAIVTVRTVGWAGFLRE